MKLSEYSVVYLCQKLFVILYCCKILSWWWVIAPFRTTMQTVRYKGVCKDMRSRSINKVGFNTVFRLQIQLHLLTAFVFCRSVNVPWCNVYKLLILQKLKQFDSVAMFWGNLFLYLMWKCWVCSRMTSLCFITISCRLLADRSTENWMRCMLGESVKWCCHSLR